MRFQGVRGQRPELQRSRITTRHIDAKPASERRTDTHTDSWKYPQQYYYSRLLWSYAHGEETRRAGWEYLPKRQAEVCCDSGPNFGMNSVVNCAQYNTRPPNNPNWPPRAAAEFSERPPPKLRKQRNTPYGLRAPADFTPPGWLSLERNIFQPVVNGGGIIR